jgi:sugar O-acyltransferase (sialic acid O-acetyltransferase NeuD family)
VSRILVIGTGDHARVVAELLHAAGHELVGYVEPDPGRSVEGWKPSAPVFAGLEADGWAAEHRGTGVVVAVGANAVRHRLHDRCVALGLVPVAVTHPSAILLGGATVGAGSQICAQALVGVSASVGPNVILNTAASIDHDVVLEAHAFVGPGARLAGRVRVGAEAHVGIGAVVREGITIGRGALVAAGAVVVDDVPAGTRVAGVPARPMDPQQVNDRE